MAAPNGASTRVLPGATERSKRPRDSRCIYWWLAAVPSPASGGLLRRRKPMTGKGWQRTKAPWRAGSLSASRPSLASGHNQVERELTCRKGPFTIFFLYHFYMTKRLHGETTEYLRADAARAGAENARLSLAVYRLARRNSGWPLTSRGAPSRHARSREPTRTVAGNDC